MHRSSLLHWLETVLKLKFGVPQVNGSIPWRMWPVRRPLDLRPETAILVVHLQGLQTGWRRAWRQFIPNPCSVLIAMRLRKILRHQIQNLPVLLWFNLSCHCPPLRASDWTTHLWSAVGLKHCRKRWHKPVSWPPKVVHAVPSLRAFVRTRASKSKISAIYACKSKYVRAWSLLSCKKPLIQSSSTALGCRSFKECEGLRCLFLELTMSISPHAALHRNCYLF